MAVRYPIISGNWSNALIWNGGTLPTSADDVYANGFTVTIDVDITVLTLRNTAQSPAVAGGGFLITGNNINVTCTTTYDHTTYGTVTLLTVNSTGTVNVNLNYISTQLKDGFLLNVINTGTINYTGIFHGGGAGIGQISISAACTFNFIGNIRQTSTGGGVRHVIGASANNYTLNITGDIGFLTGGQTGGCVFIGGNGTINVTGNITGSSSLNQVGITLGISTLNVTGSLIGGGFASAVSASLATYIKVIGSIISQGSFGVSSSSVSAINIFTGPFICSPSGVFPLSLFRMHYFRTLGSYFEFRDETTNGALPPAAAAPATRLVSPDTVVDAPIPTNVRDGITYALGTFTGSLKVPPPNSVAAGVPTDNTVGNAVLTPQAVWDYATANLTDANSIGARLKNVSTVDTTGEQLEALL